jgi:hypothetical protein
MLLARHVVPAKAVTRNPSPPRGCEVLPLSSKPRAPSLMGTVAFMATHHTFLTGRIHFYALSRRFAPGYDRSVPPGQWPIALSRFSAAC